MEIMAAVMEEENEDGTNTKDFLVSEEAT